MQRVPWAMFLWPGLPQLWMRREWAGLAKAIGAAVVLNAVLLGTFGWSELVGSGMRTVLWFAVAVFWTVSAIAGYKQTRRRTKHKQLLAAKDTFGQALDHYLKGDYFQAECLLVELVARNERDLDTRLMLATLYRHNRRYEEATKELDTLLRYEGAEKWSLEIESERKLIAEGKCEAERQEIVLPGVESNSPLSHAA